MLPESAKYLRDVLDAAHAIEQYTQECTAEEFLALRWLRDAVNWNFCIIGEALSQLKRIDQPLVERITDYWKIIGLRNQLIHGYGVINNQITWDIIQSKLPMFIQEVERLIAK